MTSPAAPHVVCRFLVVCAVVLGAALYIPHWAVSSGGSEAKYVAREVAVGLFAVHGGRRALDWSELRERDVEVPGAVEGARAFSIAMGIAALLAMLASALGAYQRRAPTTRWARILMQATAAGFIGWLLLLAQWQGFVPSYGALLALGALGSAWWALGRVPLRAELAPLGPILPPRVAGGDMVQAPFAASLAAGSLVHDCPACSTHLQWAEPIQRWWCVRCEAPL